ncbi:MAG: hypothetical protein AB8D78_15120 [Akkermansiaceae bacterium]
MKNSSLKTLCVFASIGSILMSLALMITALSPRMTSSWGEVASGFTPHAILIVGGLISLAICSSNGSKGE